MGERLLKYYRFVGEKAGLSGKVTLARSTNMTVSKAAAEPDNLTNLELFREAVAEILHELPPNY